VQTAPLPAGSSTHQRPAKGPSACSSDASSAHEATSSSRRALHALAQALQLSLDLAQNYLDVRRMICCHPANSAHHLHALCAKRMAP
jgi:hypothetical protein